MPKSMSVYESNLSKIQELHLDRQGAAEQWLDECEGKGLHWRCAEAYRSQERQDSLYLVGRLGKPGEKPVTWTRTSLHTKRLAMDIYPVTKLTGKALVAFYESVDSIGKRYGIYRPAELVKLGDLGHYQFDKAKAVYPAPVYPTSLEARKRRAARLIDPLSGNVRERAIARYVAEFGEAPKLR